MSSVRKEVIIHGLKLFLDMGVGIGGDKWPAADLVRSCNIYASIAWEKVKCPNIDLHCSKEMATILFCCNCLAFSKFSYGIFLVQFCQFIMEDHWKNFFDKLFAGKRIIELGNLTKEFWCVCKRYTDKRNESDVNNDICC